MTNRIYGWFSDPAQTTPVHEPPLDAPCLFCGEVVFDGDVRTISMMYADRRDGRSYFYRVHRTCHERATEEARQKIDGIVLDMIANASGA
jgi:hypothetical protein